jgi:hypothetical protein
LVGVMLFWFRKLSQQSRFLWGLWRRGLKATDIRQMEAGRSPPRLHGTACHPLSPTPIIMISVARLCRLLNLPTPIPWARQSDQKELYGSLKFTTDANQKPGKPGQPCFCGRATNSVIGNRLETTPIGHEHGQGLHDLLHAVQAHRLIDTIAEGRVITASERKPHRWSSAGWGVGGTRECWWPRVRSRWRECRSRARRSERLWCTSRGCTRAPSRSPPCALAQASASCRPTK